jgi:hypothetical protein
LRLLNGPHAGSEDYAGGNRKETQMDIHGGRRAERWNCKGDL